MIAQISKNYLRILRVFILFLTIVILKDFVLNTFLFTSQIYYLILCIISLIILTLILKLQKNYVINLSLSIFIINISFLVFEIYFSFFNDLRLQPRINNLNVAKEQNIYFDPRTLQEVIEDYKNINLVYLRDYTANSALNSNGYVFKNTRIFPLGGISKRNYLNCNESGKWETFVSDEHGFNNYPGLYNDKLDIAIIGDSFACGNCVEQDKTIQAILNQKGFNTLSFGSGANSSLIELATLIEYVKPLKPKKVFMLYYKNDIPTLHNEFNSKMLTNYLNAPGYNQNLIKRQNAIDELLLLKEKEFAEKSKRGQGKKLSILRKIIDFAKLTKTRYQIGREIERFKALKKENISRKKFTRIIVLANSIVENWGGIFFLVVLPSYDYYKYGIIDRNYNYVIKTAKENQIQLCDFKEDIMNSHKDPLSLFPLRQFGHYNKKGYELLANYLASVGGNYLKLTP